MPTASKKSKPLFTFDHKVKVEVHLPEFEPLESLQLLDYERFAKGTHKLEVGFLSGGCCRKLVRANVNKGMVTSLEVEPCKDSKPPSKELAAILKEARTRIVARIGKWQPIPLAEFSEVAAQIIWGGGCIRVCCFGYCITCCLHGPAGIHCFTDTIYTGPLTTR